MANYASTTFIKSFNPDRAYTSSSKPTLAQVASYIPTVTAEMNARMAGVGITIPVSTSPSTNASLYLKRLCALKSASIAEQASLAGGHIHEKGFADFYDAEYEKKMAAIEKTPGIIYALISGTSAVFDSYEYSNSDKALEADDEKFPRDTEKW